MKITDEKKEIEGLKPSPSVFKPFVNGGVAGLVTGFITGAVDYSLFHILKNLALFRNHPTYVIRCINAKMIPGMVFIDALAYSQLLGIYEIARRKAIATNEGMRPRLYQEAACGLIAGAVGPYLSFPLSLACYRKQVESMGPIAEPWRLRRKLSHVLRYAYGSPWFKTRIGLGMGMVASYEPSLHYLMESRGFSEDDAKSGAGGISALCAAVCGLLAPHASSLVFARETLRLRGPFGFLTGFSGLCRNQKDCGISLFFLVPLIKGLFWYISEAPKIMVFWLVLEQVQKDSQ